MINDEILNKLIKTIQESNKKTIDDANQRQTEDIKQHIKTEINEVKQKLEEELQLQRDEYENKYIDLKTKYEKLEKESRRNNIVIFGLKGPDYDVGPYVIDTLNHYLKINLTINDVNNAYKIGKEEEKKPILVKLVTYIKKQEILRNSKKLKGTHIFIAEDQNLEERKENKILRYHLKKARSQKLNATIKNGKLIINGQIYTAQQLTEEEIETEADYKNTEVEEVNAEEEEYELQKSSSAPATPTVLNQSQINEDETESATEVFKIETAKVTKKKYEINKKPVNRPTRATRQNSTKDVETPTSTKTVQSIKITK